MCAERFLYMLELLLPRGAASGGKQRSRGAAKSMASPQAASCRARAPASLLARAFCWTPGFAACWSAVVRAEMRTCVCGRCGGVERLAASGLGSVLCMCGASRHPCMEPLHGEVWSRDVFVSVCDFVIEYSHMCDTICKEFSHTAIISWTRSHLSGTNFADMGPQATRPQTSMLDSLETLDACCERMPSSAGGCGHQVCTWPDEKRGSARLKSLDRSPSARKK